MVEYITIRTFENPLDAHLLKTKLESEGIACLLMDDYMMSLIPLYNLTLGGVKLKVQESDSSRAQDILAEYDNTRYTNSEDNEVQCVYCGSDKFYSRFPSMRSFWGVLTAVLYFILFIYPVYFKHVYKCKSCGGEFETL